MGKRFFALYEIVWLNHLAKITWIKSYWDHVNV